MAPCSNLSDEPSNEGNDEQYPQLFGVQHTWILA
jgi:hypothetical protein